MTVFLHLDRETDTIQTPISVFTVQVYWIFLERSSLMLKFLKKRRRKTWRGSSLRQQLYKGKAVVLGKHRTNSRTKHHDPSFIEGVVDE